MWKNGTVGITEIRNQDKNEINRKNKKNKEDKEKFMPLYALMSWTK